MAHDVPVPCADGFAHPDLPCALRDGDEHDVHNPDAAHDQGDARDSPQQDGEGPRHRRRHFDDLRLVANVEIVLAALPDAMAFSHQRGDLLFHLVQIRSLAHFHVYLAQALLSQDFRRVLDREVFFRLLSHAPSPLSSGTDDQQVGTHGRDALDHLLFRSRVQRQHGDHRPHADDDSQHGQKGAQLVGHKACAGNFHDGPKRHGHSPRTTRPSR